MSFVQYKHNPISGVFAAHNRLQNELVASFWNWIRSTSNSRQWRADGVTKGSNRVNSWTDLYRSFFVSIEAQDQEISPQNRYV